MSIKFLLLAFNASTFYCIIETRSNTSNVATLQQWYTCRIATFTGNGNAERVTEERNKDLQNEVVSLQIILMKR